MTLSLESLDDRVMPSAGSISGFVYQDQTGNGLSADDTPMSNVLVELYRGSDPGFFGFGSKLAGLEFTSSNGSYSFGNLAAGQYFVEELTPFGYIETAPTPFGYSINLANGAQAGSANFDNFQLLNPFAVRNVSFTVENPNGTDTTVNDLRGNTKQGDTVVANFTIAPHSPPVTVSLVSYNAPGSSFNPATADEQTILAVDTGTFGPGVYNLSVQLPNNYYQVDFIVGPAINEFGPAGSNIFYSAQGRLLSADNGGTNAVQYGTLSGTVTDTNSNLVAGALVTVTNQANGAQYTAITNLQGGYSIPGLQAGLNYSVVVSDAGYDAQSTNLMLAAGANSENFTLVPTAPAEANLSGIVTSSGSPVANVTVSLTDQYGDFIGSDTTGPDGSYDIPDVAPGSYTLKAISGDSFETYTALIMLNAGNNSYNISMA